MGGPSLSRASAIDLRGLRPPIPRIVSLIASATEIVCALGLEGDLVGRAHECDYPASVRRLPVCAEIDFDASGTSREIDDAVRSHLRSQKPLYKINEDVMAAVRPDVIVTQAHCEVCAVNRSTVETAIGKRLSWKPTVVSLVPSSLDGLWSGIQEIATVAGVRDKGRDVVDGLKMRLRAIEDKARKAEKRPRVAVIEWIDPIMVSGNWMPELVTIAGGQPVFGEKGGRSVGIDWRQLIQAAPDAIVAAPCGFDLPRTRAEMGALADRGEWMALDAVLNNRVFLADGNQFFNRPGPRLVESAEILAEMLHPDLFDFGHQNAGWEYFGIAG